MANEIVVFAGVRQLVILKLCFVPQEVHGGFCGYTLTNMLVNATNANKYEYFILTVFY